VRVLEIPGATGGAGSVATDTLFDAVGDLAVGSGPDAAGKLSKGADFTKLIVDSAQSFDLRWATDYFIDVKVHHGATGTNSGDDSVAINAAVNAVPQSGNTTGGTIWFGSGKYLCLSTINLSAKNGIRLLGPGVVSHNEAITSGRGAMLVAGTADMTLVTVDNGTGSVYHWGPHIDGLNFRDNIGGTGTGVTLLYIRTTNRGTVRNCSFRGIGSGTGTVAITGDWGSSSLDFAWWKFDNLFISNCNIAYNIIGTFGFTINDGLISNPTGTAPVGIKLRNSSKVKVFGLMMDADDFVGATAIDIDDNSSGNYFYGLKLEKFPTMVSIGQSGPGTCIGNAFFGTVFGGSAAVETAVTLGAFSVDSHFWSSRLVNINTALTADASAKGTIFQRTGATGTGYGNAMLSLEAQAAASIGFQFVRRVGQTGNAFEVLSSDRATVLSAIDGLGNFFADGYFDFDNIVLPPNPASGRSRIFRDNADQIFKLLKPDGTLLNLETDGLASRTTATAAISTTETVVISRSLPANFLKAGTQLRIEASGVGTTGSTPGSTTWRMRIGPVTLTGNIASTLVAPNTASRTAMAWTLDAMFSVRTAGAAGTCIGNINVHSNVSTNDLYTSVSNVAGTSSTVAVDTTVVNLFELTVTTGAATSTVTCHIAAIDIVKL
jgi:hypothetical protein